MTEILPADDQAARNKAVDLLKKGDVVVFSTDTIYGIGASIAKESGIKKIFEVKSRSPDKPLIIYVASFEQLQQVTQEIPESTIESLRKIWPGAMSGIFPKTDIVPPFVTSGKDTVAVRIPNHPLCLELVRQVGAPLAVTSANVSGMETQKTAPEVAAQLGERVPLVLDGGPNPEQQPSTLVDFTGSPAQLLREGAWSFSKLRQAIPDLQPIPES
ncbi:MULTISPECIES: L-threonylcarbamoyladenylate synthase [Moorena]|uniref:L-threonylcarbamoyladenylate synthase n=1 Tax=Moorena producens 3L TaxID=489825 RepID=F4XS13_9CYAN|nr:MULTISPECIES: L-threonylcarbamoyladenylate synthase [Moorena]NEQ16771.1 threonylcarbamoyl-AMP synthase [Moorena sp. SIO3E2]EGJ32605.1 Sua5/YciO/YrdC/YwlC family protein [Moorena producens 3L]NEP30386.1 threonylcarbamoyl-AMP synthase [Moorena sp. SIO3B2]NEP66400.1 threonylcarbamoyl-AMP synthase [Moorena sp. SIO3A5]NEQ08048.1 threonylcarbamoyl-AMP synthase [Moorena sp. SIO4E2]